MPSGLLRSTLLIAKREYLQRVRSRVFRITTLLVPIGMAGLAMLGGLGTKKLAGPENMAIVAANPTLANDVRTTLEEGEAGTEAPRHVEVYAPATAADMAALEQQIAKHAIAGYLEIDEATGDAQPIATWVSSSSVDFFRREQMEGALRSALIRQELLARGMSPEQVKDLMQQVHLKTMQVKNGAVVASNSERSFAGAYGLILVLYASVLIYGINIARSVVEEKTSRIFEVLLSTASPDSLMLGKLLGVGAVGLTQIGIWAALLAFYAGSAMAAREGIHGLASLGLTRAELIYFPIFFLGGFYLYSALGAALGSGVSAEQEIQQFSFILISPLVASVVLLPYVIGSPSSTTSVVLSLLPPFTPIIMYMRICAQMPPLWQVGLSIALLAASVWGMVWIAARIYRIGVLMYGKRATLPEMLRWLKYS